MHFIDLEAQQRRIRKEINDRITAVLDHGQYIMGPEIKQLEKTLADYVGVKHAVSCASGTDALLLALMAYGVGPGDAVFTSPFTFIATAEVIQLLGATPVFVDIDLGTFYLRPTAAGRRYGRRRGGATRETSASKKPYECTETQSRDRGRSFRVTGGLLGDQPGRRRAWSCRDRGRGAVIWRRT